MSRLSTVIELARHYNLPVNMAKNYAVRYITDPAEVIAIMKRDMKSLNILRKWVEDKPYAFSTVRRYFYRHRCTAQETIDHFESILNAPDTRFQERCERNGTTPEVIEGLMEERNWTANQAFDYVRYLKKKAQSKEKQKSSVLSKAWV